MINVNKKKLKNAKILEKRDGVEIRILDPEVRKDEVQGMTESCKTGNNSCCTPDFLVKNKIGVSGKDGDVSISINGNATKKEMEEKLQNCDCSCFD